MARRERQQTLAAQGGDLLPEQVRGARRPSHATASERARRGLAARSALPPGEQSALILPADRPGVASVLKEQADTRVPELVPVRHGRMQTSPFTFYRGNARGMAIDLAASPNSGLRVQLCGDAHLSNFGLFASPERRLLFDVNDFDETTPGPWEWDVKRLAASIVVAGRSQGFSRKERRKVVRGAVRRYRDATAEFAGMRALEIWYARAEVDDVRKQVSKSLNKRHKKNLDKAVAKAVGSDSLKALAKLTETIDGQVRIKADPPLIVPVSDLLPSSDRLVLQEGVHRLLHGYGRTLTADRRVLLDRFQFVDLARKVVGVGSVGTRCWIALMLGRDESDPLFLQVKEAAPSVLRDVVPAPMRPRHPARNEGQRVVVGQRLMQAASDIFLGWERIEGIDGKSRDFYVRQLRDMKGSAVIEQMDPTGMKLYGEACAWTLARAHARSGDPIAVAAYLGTDESFPDAIARYAELYADQNEKDHADFLEALRTGELTAERAT